MLVLDGSYHCDVIRTLGLEQSVVSRDLDGFFGHVWTANPFGDLTAKADFGPPQSHEMNARHTFIQARSGRFPWFSAVPAVNFLIGQAGLFLQLRRLIKRERIDLVRAGDPLYVGLLGWALATICGLPFAIRVNANNDKMRKTSGNLVYPRLLRFLWLEKAIEHFVFKRASLVAAPNQDNVDFALANGAHRDRVAIFPYGNLLAPGHQLASEDRPVDQELFERLEAVRGRYLLCVGRLKALKFPDDAVRVLAAARAARHDVALILAGEGEMRGALERLAMELEVRDHLIMPGNLDQDDLAQLYTGAAVVISPLTGRALSEAALAGAPIAAYDLDWQGDLIQTGKTGELVPFRDQQALAAAVVKLLDDPAYARRLGKGAREAALEMFDADRLLANERAAYANIVTTPTNMDKLTN